MKIIFKAFLCSIAMLVVMTALVIPCVADSSDTLEIYATRAEGERGETVEVTLSVGNNPGFAILWINIPSECDIEVVEIKNGTIIRNMTAAKNIIWDDIYNTYAVGTLATVKLRIGENARAGLNLININLIQCIDQNTNKVNVSLEPINIYVLGEPLEETHETVTDFEEKTEEGISEADTRPSEETEEINKVESENDTNQKEPEGNTDETAADGDAPSIDSNTENSEDPDESTSTDAPPTNMPTTDGESQTDETEHTEKTDGNENDRIGGCGQSLSGAVIAVVLPLCAWTVINKRKR